MSTPLSSRLTRRRLYTCASASVIALAFPFTGIAQSPSTLPLSERYPELDPYTITASRTPVAPASQGSVVDSFSASELSRRQITSFSQALALASVPVFSSGQMGGTTSIFLRGANSNQTLFLVDGLRLNDPNTDYAVFLGGACVSACDSLEIAHGPQSTLYGGEAVGGVISLRSLRGKGAPTGRVSIEAGSFGTLQGAASVQAEQGPWAYNVAVQGGRTENDRINNDFESGNVTVRLDRALTETISVGATVRGFHGVYGSPGTRFTNDPDNEERESNWLATTFADVRHNENLSSHVVLGGQLRRFVSENPGSFGTSITVVKNRRGVLDWQTTYEGLEKHRITGGFTAEANHTRNTGFGDINESQSLLAFFLQDEITPVEQVHVTVGLRHDDFDTFGQHTTGKASVAWNVLPGRVKLRASGGTAFRSPSFLDLYGRNAFYVGNPNLKPERARGGDVGIDYYLPNNGGTVGVTWFENRFKDLIVSDFSRNPSSMANVDRASTRGAEVSLSLPLVQSTQVRASYTYLEAENDQTHRRLLRRPRHIGNVDVFTDFGSGLTVGAGLRVVAQREDVHASNFSTIDGENYSVVRLYAAWAINESLTVRARVENLLDESYEEVHGYPQLPVGGFAALEWRW